MTMRIYALYIHIYISIYKVCISISHHYTQNKYTLMLICMGKCREAGQLKWRQQQSPNETNKIPTTIHSLPTAQLMNRNSGPCGTITNALG